MILNYLFHFEKKSVSKVTCGHCNRQYGGIPLKETVSQPQAHSTESESAVFIFRSSVDYYLHISG